MDKKRIVFVIIGVILLLIISTTGTIIGFYLSKDVKIHLYVSNQSPHDNPINITIFFDSDEKFNQTCYIYDAHHWVLIEFELSKGKHDLKVIEREHGTEEENDFRTYGERWIVINYWYTPVYNNDQIQREISIDILDKPPAFM